MVNGSLEARLPGNLNVSFPGHDGERLLACTPSIAAATAAGASSGRACPAPATIRSSPRGNARASRFPSATNFGSSSPASTVTGRSPSSPKRCHNGHPLAPPNVSVGYGEVPDENRRATGWPCRTCGNTVWEPAEPAARTYNGR